MLGGAPEVSAVLDALTAAIWQQWIVPFLLVSLPILAILYIIIFIRWRKHRK